MSGINRMTGIPWHVAKMIRADGDARRHKARCQYYTYSSEYCSCLKGRCMGSAHCDEYKAVSDEEFKKRQIAKQKANNKKINTDADIYWYD